MEIEAALICITFKKSLLNVPQLIMITINFNDNVIDLNCDL